jgi:hypothetical protein
MCTDIASPYAFISCTLCKECIIWETDDILTHSANNGKKEKEEVLGKQFSLLRGQGEE